MKASELIEELRKKIEDYGDWEVSAGIKRYPVLDEETGEVINAPEQYPVSEIRVRMNRAERRKYIKESR